MKQESEVSIALKSLVNSYATLHAVRCYDKYENIHCDVARHTANHIVCTKPSKKGTEYEKQENTRDVLLTSWREL